MFFLRVFLIPFEADRPGRLSFKPLLGAVYFAVWRGVYVVYIVSIEVFMLGEHGQRVSLLHLLPMQDSRGPGQTWVWSACLALWPWCFPCWLLSLIISCPWRTWKIALCRNFMSLAHAVPSSGVFYQTGVHGARGWSPSALFPLCPRSTGPLLSPCPCRCQCHIQGCSHRPSIPVTPNWLLASQQSWRGHRNHLLLILLSAIPVPPHS